MLRVLCASVAELLGLRRAPVTKLSEKAYWDTIHEAERSGRKKRALKTRVMRLAGKIGGPRLVEYMRNYTDHLLWDVILPRHMPDKPAATVLEIGSAPGAALVEMHRRFGFVPHGVDYSESGAELNRTTFAENGLDPANVIQADFFSEEFQSEHKERFDIVMSRGFIEHFTNVEDCVKRHVDLLAAGGRLIVSIPNLRGVNCVLSWLFNREVLRLHNLEIMREEAFARLFRDKGLRPLFCGYVGVFDFRLFNADPRSPIRFLLALCMKAQYALNVALRLLFRDQGAATSLFSPYLLYIGEKRQL